MGTKKYAVTGYIGNELKKKVDYFVSTNNYSQSELVNAALSAYLQDDDYWSIVFKRLNRQKTALDNVDKRLEILTELNLLYLRYWFALSPELTDDEKTQVKIKGDMRYNKFMGSFKKVLPDGGLLYEHLESYLKENIED